MELSSQSNQDLALHNIEDTPAKKKPGPPAKPKVDMKHIDALMARIADLESVVIRMAHNSGTAHTILKAANLEPYNPTKADMSKYKRAK